MQRDAFHHFMDSQFSSLPTWLDVLDFQAEISVGFVKEDVVFVDVDGGQRVADCIAKENLSIYQGAHDLAIPGLCIGEGHGSRWYREDGL